MSIAKSCICAGLAGAVTFAPFFEYSKCLSQHSLDCPLYPHVEVLAGTATFAGSASVAYPSANLS